MTTVDTSELLDVAAASAGAAGELLVGGRQPGGPEVTGTKSSPTDVVTAMDTAAEELIVRTVRGRRPGDAILAEESGSGGGESAVRWVIDPLDGTVNYLYGIPEWAVSIAAEVEGTTVAGAVYIAPRDELFTARRGAGAWRNGEPLPRVGTRDTVASESGLQQALIATGFSYTAETRARQADVLRGLLPGIRDVRRGGASSVDLCSVACGRVDGYFERGLSPWDFAAGVLIAKEVGIRVEGAYGRPAGKELTIAAPPWLFGELHELVVGWDEQLAGSWHPSTSGTRTR